MIRSCSSRRMTKSRKIKTPHERYTFSCGVSEKWRPQGDLNPCRRRERAIFYLNGPEPHRFNPFFPDFYQPKGFQKEFQTQADLPLPLPCKCHCFFTFSICTSAFQYKIDNIITNTTACKTKHSWLKKSRTRFGYSPFF